MCNDVKNITLRKCRLKKERETERQRNSVSRGNRWKTES